MMNEVAVDYVECTSNCSELVRAFTDAYPLPTLQKPQPELRSTNYGGLSSRVFRKKNRTLASKHASVDMPITAYTKEILTQVGQNQLTFICGPTGSGKTTQVPMCLLRQCTEQNKPCLIFCTQPRRLAVLAVANYVASCIGESPGGTIGYAIHLDTKVSADTRLVFCTPAVLTKMLASPEQRAEISHVVLDEVHERELHTDCLLAMLKLTIKDHPNTKLVLMSATMMSIEQQMKTYFGSSTSAATVSVHVHGYRIHTLYIDSIEHGLAASTSFTPQDMQSTPLEHAPAGSSSFIEHGINYELLSRVLKWLMDAKINGSILVFLPGMEQINQTLRKFKASDCKTKMVADFHVLHSSKDKDVQLEAITPAEAGVRKIILSTNIAETSVTIPDAVFVVDCGLVRENVFNTYIRSSRLDTRYTTKSNAEQRKGRIGRCQAGYCFRMYTESEYMAMDSLPTPEITIADLHSTCLSTHEYVPPGFTATEFLAATPTPPDPARVTETMEFLESIGAICTIPRHIQGCAGSETQLTYLGNWITKMSLDPQLSKMIIYGLAFQCAIPTVIIVAALATGNIFTIHADGAGHVEYVKTELAHGVFSDHFVLLQLLYGFYGTLDQHTYCKQHGTTVNKLKEVTRVVKGICKELLSISHVLDPMKDWCNTNSTCWQSIKAVIVAGCYPYIGQYKSTKQIVTEKGDLELSNHCVGYTQQKTANFTAPTLVMYNETAEIPGHTLIKTVTSVSTDSVVLFGHGSEMEMDLFNSLFNPVDQFACSDEAYTVYIRNCKFGGTAATMKGLISIRFRIMKYVHAFTKNPVVHADPKSVKFQHVVRSILENCEPRDVHIALYMKKHYLDSAKKSISGYSKHTAMTPRTVVRSPPADIVDHRAYTQRNVVSSNKVVEVRSNLMQPPAQKTSCENVTTHTGKRDDTKRQHSRRYLEAISRLKPIATYYC